MHKLDDWIKFSKGQQMGAIAAEITRAKVWQEKDKNHFLSAMERALNLIDLTLEDGRWRNWRSMLFWLRDEVAKIYSGQSSQNINFLTKTF